MCFALYFFVQIKGKQQKNDFKRVNFQHFVPLLNQNRPVCTNKVVGRSQSPLSLARVVHFRPCFASKCFPAQPLLMQMVSRGSVSTTTSLGDKWCTLKPTLFHKSFVQKNKKVLVQKWCYVFLTTECLILDFKNHSFHKALLNS